jgi:hypothetical protein
VRYVEDKEKRGVFVKIVLPFLFLTPVFSDGLSDVIVASPSAGVNHVFTGGANMGRVLNVNTHDLLSSRPAISYDFSGRSVSNAGDVNGDGYDDLIIGVPYAARCYVLFGNRRGFLNMTEGFTMFGAQSSDLTGWSVSGAGDVNNDTFADLIIGAPGTNSETGTVYVLYGRALQHNDIIISAISAHEGRIYIGAAQHDVFGVSVSGADDCIRCVI